MTGLDLAKNDLLQANFNLVEHVMITRIISATVFAIFMTTGALAQTCEFKAVSKEGKPLTGAAKNSFVNKCKKETCETKAVSADGKKLSGAAKNSFMKKCESEA